MILTLSSDIQTRQLIWTTSGCSTIQQQLRALNLLLISQPS